VESSAPSFAAAVALLGPDGRSLGQDFRLKRLSASAAHAIVQAIDRVRPVPWRDFLGPGEPEASALGRFGAVPPAAALQEVFHVARETGASWELGEAFASQEELICWYYDALCDLVRPRPADFSALLSVEEVLPSVYCVRAASQLVLASMFLRPQEYYECPADSIRHRRFTLQDYKAWCQEERSPRAGGGGFNYYLQWPGFNVPSWVLDDLRAGSLGPLAPQEEALLTCLPPNDGPYYVIGTMELDAETLRHELAHGLYTTRPDYRATVQGLLDGLPPDALAGMRERLLRMGYCDDSEILRDEMQAYICEGNCLGCRDPGIQADVRAAFELHSELARAAAAL